MGRLLSLSAGRGAIYKAGGGGMTGPGPRGRDKEFTLPQQVLRSLADKLYDKRKAAAMELEQAVKGLVDEGDDEAIGAVVNQLVEDFALAPQANQRKGGLIGLAACAVGLAQSPNSYLDRIIPPVIKAFTDNDPRVRYYACESLYNIAKVRAPAPRPAAAAARPRRRPLTRARPPPAPRSRGPSSRCSSRTCSTCCASSPPMWTPTSRTRPTCWTGW